MIKNVFYGVMLRILNPQKCIQEELHRMKKSLLMILIMMGLSFLCEKKILEIETKNNICINVFCYKNKMIFPIYVSDQEFENSILMKTSQIMRTSKILTDLCFTKQKMKTKIIFARDFCSILVVKMCWQNIKKFVWALVVHNL